MRAREASQNGVIQLADYLKEGDRPDFRAHGRPSGLCRTSTIIESTGHLLFLCSAVCGGVGGLDAVRVPGGTPTIKGQDSRICEGSFCARGQLTLRPGEVSPEFLLGVLGQRHLQ